MSEFWWINERGKYGPGILYTPVSSSVIWCSECPCPVLYLQYIHATVTNNFGPVGEPTPFDGDIVNGQPYEIDIKTRGFAPGVFLEGSCNFTITLPEIIALDCLPEPLDLLVQFVYPTTPPPDWILNYFVCETVNSIDPYDMTTIDVGQDITCSECQPESSAFFEFVSPDGLRGNSLEITWKYDYCPPPEP